MKRIFRRILLLVVAALLVILTVDEGAVFAQTLKHVSIAAGSSTGSWYLVAGGQATVISKYVKGVKATAEPGGGSVNLIRVAKKDVTFGMVMSDSAFYGMKGKREYDRPYREIRAIYGGHNNPMKLIVRADSDIESVADLKGKKIGMGHPGSVTAVTAVELMKVHGFKPDKDYVPRWLTPGETTEALRDKTIDAGFIYIADPSGVMLDLTSKILIRFIPMAVNKIIAEHPYWYKTAVLAGTYRGMNKDYETQGANVILITHKDTDRDLVYQVTKALIEHVGEVATAHRAGKEWNRDNAKRGIVIPFHPGSEKYLKEIGAIK